ncbi:MULTISPECIES: 50S ribosomal protein L15 [Pyramidobacter]|uniref:Large ribosomal subunit protein uL15 n=2 Tax=Pyramidobacter TaxID=638847 RepID=A0ABM9ZTJ4_9BACT|nr:MULTISPECIES: 50S ribosomal protein L15 [Pyramidobacter]EFB90175.1 ribosomal protein L15 [Pyramidobacter piscolens W5455]MCI7403115.1 50S ribosomal protein L15 [Pyramidobacter sp.]MDY2647690.1 50S ribosomal protein L15 [Pyramidobacter porci]MDY3212668.1 50S ribosomal protein L15 [Pyramidobacter sp.]MST54818.1 50S ribosomal protein L15 [Pyramidobacter porci]
MNLSDLRPAEGAKHKAKRVGCGIGSGNGKTAGRGTKGYGSRAGSAIRPGFEGGQMPLVRRTPKRGFNNYNFAKVYQIANLGDIAEIFKEGAVITVNELFAYGLVRNMDTPVKILGDGELDKPLTIKAEAFSKSAAQKIAAAGGTAEVI